MRAWLLAILCVVGQMSAASAGSIEDALRMHSRDWLRRSAHIRPALSRDWIWFVRMRGCVAPIA